MHIANTASPYWKGNDEFEVACWTFTLPDQEKIRVFMEDLQNFLKQYVIYCTHYRILQPISTILNQTQSIESVGASFLQNYADSIAAHFHQPSAPYNQVISSVPKDFYLQTPVSLQTLYGVPRHEVYPSYMRTSLEDDAFSPVVAISDQGVQLADLTDLLRNERPRGVPPVKLRSSNGYLHFSIYHDAFEGYLRNGRTSQSAVKSIKQNGVSNYDLALHNTPRFNSFLRKIGELMNKYGATVNFDTLEPTIYTQMGVLLNGELLFLEELYDLL